MQCVILAAGTGSRLQLRGDSKPLIPVFGVPLIERVIDAALEADVSRFLVVTGHRAAKLEAFLKQLAERKDIEIETVFNAKHQLENGYSALTVRQRIKEPFLLLMADHIITAESLKRLMRGPVPTDGIVLGVDSDLKNPRVDLNDVTRVLLQDDKIRDIGKGLSAYNAFDTGMFVCTPALFDAIDQAGASGDTSLSGAVRVLAEAGRARAIDIGRDSWIDVDDPDALRRAEEVLLARLQSEALEGTGSA